MVARAATIAAPDPAPNLARCPPSTSSPRSTIRKCATRSIRPGARSTPDSTSRTPTRRSSRTISSLTLRTVSEDRLAALRVVLEERLVKRGVSLKGVDYGTIEEATHNTVRQVVTIKVGISSDKAREVNKLIKAKHPKGVSTPDPGRFGPGQRQEARRPAGRDRHVEGHRPRHPPAVQQLPRLETSPIRLGSRRESSTRRSPRRACGEPIDQTRVGDQTLTGDGVR